MTDKFYNRKRMAWQLYIFSDLSIEEIAERVAIPIKDVEKYIKEKSKDDCEFIGVPHKSECLNMSEGNE